MDRGQDAVADAKTTIIDFVWINAVRPTIMQRMMKIFYTFEMDMTRLKDETETKPLEDILTDEQTTEDTKDAIVSRVKFVNKSDEAQQLTFKTEKSTTSTCEITISCGLKNGESSRFEFHRHW
jgi:hypothetical protein